MAGWLTGTLPSYSSVSGLEKIEVDTNLAGGGAPQSVFLNPNQLAGSNFTRDLLDGSDFTVNPWQRGTTFTGITNTLTYTADRFFAVGASGSSISVSQQAITAGTLPGFGNSLQFGRASSNTDVNAIKLGQVIETGDAIRAQGQPLCFSFYALPGGNWSAANSALTVSVYSGTGTNQSAASLIAGTWTNQTTLYSGPVQISNTAWGPRFVIGGTAGSVTSNITGGLTGAPAASGAINPAMTMPSNATQLGIVLSYTPTGTAGTNDWIQLAGLQLEAGNFPSQFEHLDVQLELEIAQRYFYSINEPASGVIAAIGGATAAANNQNFILFTPVQMMKAPTVTVSAGSWKVAAGTTAAAATGFAAGATHTVNQITVVTTLTQTAGQAAHLQGGGGSGYIYASADF